MSRRFLVPAGSRLDNARLYQALREAGLHAVLNPQDAERLAPLRSLIPVEGGSAPLLPGIQVDHSGPRVRVGSISRPCLLPQRLVHLCSSLWSQDRCWRASFRGLRTERRERLLKRWIGSNEVSVEWSERGRHSETKYWDVGYFAEMASSECVLCPDGDLPYSYRTYEAALCGALPIVEKHHPCYGALYTVQLSEVSPNKLPGWCEQLALENLAIATELVTIPAEDLRLEVYRLAGWTQSE